MGTFSVAGFLNGRLLVDNSACGINFAKRYKEAQAVKSMSTKTISMSRLLIAGHCTVYVLLGLVPVNLLAQHVHGVIELGVVVDDATVAVSLRAPLSDVIGFEHAPKSDAQREVLEQAAAMLSRADEMFGPTASAGCEVSNSSVEGPEFIEKHVTTHQAAANDHDDHHGHDDHDEHDNHDDHDSGSHEDEHHGHDDEHSEISANYEWTCSEADNLRALDLRFIEGFANVENIEIQIITSAGARVLDAGADTKTIPLAPE